MHVIHLNLAKGFRESEAQTFRLIHYLYLQGIQQTLICRPSSLLAQKTKTVGIPIHPIGNPLAGHWKYLGGDIVHVHDNRSIYWAWFEYFFSKTPYVITRRRSTPISNGFLTQRAFRNAAALVGTSEESALALSENLYSPVEIIPDNMNDYDPTGSQYLKLYRAILKHPTGVQPDDIKDICVIDPSASVSHNDNTSPPHSILRP